MCNSRTRFSTKKLESGIGVHKEEQTYVLQKMIQTAEMMRCVARKTSNLPFQWGIIITSKSLLALFETLSQRYKIEFLMTSHLNQDSIKNYFCRIWVIGGSNLHPASMEKNSLLEEHQILLSKQHQHQHHTRLTSLMTSHLNQVSIKNYFCRVWAIGGRNLHPASTDQKTHCWKSIRSCC